MSLVLDTGVLYAYYDRRDAWHEQVLPLLDEERGIRVLPAPVIPEIDYFLDKRLGTSARLAFYEDIERGVYIVIALPSEHYARVFDLNRRYQDLGLGFVDAAVITIAETLGIGRVATTDRRHFSAVSATIALELLP